MLTYVRLAEPDRTKRRTAMDALEVLRKQAGFQDNDTAQFHIGLMRLPSGEKVGLVDIRYHNPASDTVNCVSLPTSRHFSAIPTGFPVSRRFEIFRLNLARVDGVGRVQLEDQIELRALEVEPARLPVQPSDLDWRIVHLTLELIDARDCYRSLREGLPLDQHHLVPDERFFDVARVSGLAVPPLKEISGFIAGKYKQVSGQQIANSLRKFGIRHPQARGT